MTDNRRATRIKKLFKDVDTVRKDNVDHAKGNLEENKAVRKKKPVRHHKKGWSRRLFYGPGTIWGAGGRSDNDGPDGDGDADDGGSTGSGAVGGTGGDAGGGS